MESFPNTISTSSIIITLAGELLLAVAHPQNRYIVVVAEGRRPVVIVPVVLTVGLVCIVQVRDGTVLLYDKVNMAGVPAVCSAGNPVVFGV